MAFYKNDDGIMWDAVVLAPLTHTPCKQVQTATKTMMIATVEKIAMRKSLAFQLAEAELVIMRPIKQR